MKKPMTRYQYAKELVIEHGVDYAIEFFEERVKSKENHKTFQELCDWSGDKTVLESLKDGKIQESIKNEK